MRRALALRMGYPMRMLSRLMTYAEFLDWSRTFAEAPFDDYALVKVPTAELRASIHNAQVSKPENVLHPEYFLPKPAFKAKPVLVDDDVFNFDDQVMRLQ